MSKGASRQLRGDFAALLPLMPSEAGAGKADELDAELFACCREATEVNRVADLAMNGVDSISWDSRVVMDALSDALPIIEAYDEAVHRAGQLRARTPEGLRAKAELLLLHVGAEQDCTLLAGSLARDLSNT